MRLTAYIITAADGHLVVGCHELPALTTPSRNLDELPELMRAQAARLTGRPAEDFVVVRPY